VAGRITSVASEIIRIQEGKPCGKQAAFIEEDMSRLLLAIAV
jgi:hypothetical protein